MFWIKGWLIRLLLILSRPLFGCRLPHTLRSRWHLPILGLTVLRLMRAVWGRFPYCARLAFLWWPETYLLAALSSLLSMVRSLQLLSLPGSAEFPNPQQLWHYGVDTSSTPNQIVATVDNIGSSWPTGLHMLQSRSRTRMILALSLLRAEWSRAGQPNAWHCNGSD